MYIHVCTLLYTLLRASTIKDCGFKKMSSYVCTLYLCIYVKPKNHMVLGTKAIQYNTILYDIKDSDSH